jgi:DNA-binding NtrC family response regulator
MLVVGGTVGRVLIVDDDASVRGALRLLLEAGGFEVQTAASPREALERVAKATPDVVLLNAAVSQGPRVEFLRELHRRAPMAPVVLLTEPGDVEARGHRHLPKPIDPDELRRALDALIVPHVGELVGASPTMREIERLVVRLARSPASTVLITGESGTGKNLLASVLHRASRRADAPFMNITCSALPETLLDSELFGHERGAFTDARERKLGLLERARGGTVFLDEIGEMSPALQGKMLRFIEEKTFRRVGGHEDIRADVRVVAATHRNLEDACRIGAFREDLFYRLAVLTVHVPPLRERPEDIEPLVRSFMNRFAEDFGKRVLDIESAALAQLAAQPWPGNVRQLRNLVERAVLLADDAVLRVRDFRGQDRKRPSGSWPLPDEGIDLEELEKDLVRQALVRSRGNRSEAGRLLGLNRDQVRYRIQKFGLE